jgi:hypothetical protein
MKMMQRCIELSRVGGHRANFHSQSMGGYSRWNVLGDCSISRGLRVSQPRLSSGCSRGRQSSFGMTGIFSSGTSLSGGPVSRLVRSSNGTHRQSNVVFFSRDVIGVAQLERSMAARPIRWLGQCQFCVQGTVSHKLCIDLASMRRQGGDAKVSTSLRDTRAWSRVVCQNLERPPSESRFGSVEQHMRSFPPIHSC